MIGIGGDHQKEGEIMIGVQGDLQKEGEMMIGIERDHQKEGEMMIGVEAMREGVLRERTIEVEVETELIRRRSRRRTTRNVAITRIRSGKRKRRKRSRVAARMTISQERAGRTSAIKCVYSDEVKNCREETLSSTTILSKALISNFYAFLPLDSLICSRVSDR